MFYTKLLDLISVLFTKKTQIVLILSWVVLIFCFMAWQNSKTELKNTKEKLNEAIAINQEWNNKYKVIEKLQESKNDLLTACLRREAYLSREFSIVDTLFQQDHITSKIESIAFDTTEKELTLTIEEKEVPDETIQAIIDRLNVPLYQDDKIYTNRNINPNSIDNNTH